MNENLQRFMQLAAVDGELLGKLQNAVSPEDAYKIASDFCGGYTYEEFVDAMTKINESLATANDGELSDEDLAIISGGKGMEVQPFPILGPVFGPTVPVQGAAATAAS